MDLTVNQKAMGAHCLSLNQKTEFKKIFTDDSAINFVKYSQVPCLFLDPFGWILSSNKHVNYDLNLDLNSDQNANLNIQSLLDKNSSNMWRFIIKNTFKENAEFSFKNNEKRLVSILPIENNFIIQWKPKLLENELMRELNEKIEKSSKLMVIGQMAGSIAHEINNPLTIMIGAIAQIKNLTLRHNSIPSNLLDKPSHTLEKSIDRIARIVRLLKQSIHPHKNNMIQSININILIDDLKELCKARLNSLNINVNCVFSEGREWKVLADPTSLSQVFLNLFSNSCDALEESDEPRWIDISFKEEGSFLKLFFTDSGLGIPQKVQKDMFEPFVTTKPIGKGTGLGLGLCLKYMKEMNGNFEYNQSSKNTQFILSLPFPEK